MKKGLALILTLIMVLGLMPAAMAETEPALQQQIGNYYKANQNNEGELEDTPSQSASEWVYNGDNQQVGVKKTISGTDEENVFDIKLEVQTKQDLMQISSANEKAAVVLVMDVSGSMENNLQGAKNAAQDFINSFANVSNAENRKVAIVKFSGNKVRNGNNKGETIIDGARTVQEWTNASSIKTAGGSLCDALNGLTANGGTNIHAGLLLAKNLLGTIGNDYSKNIVLFTDGNPTFHVTGSEVQSTSTVVICETGSKNTIGGTGGETYHDDHHSVETTVEEIQEAGITPYAIYLGNNNIQCNTNNEWGSCIIDSHRYENEYSYPKDYAISAWLEDAGFTAYSATSADDLSKIFTSIAEFISISAQAWQVTDPMGAMVDFVKFPDTNDTKYQNKKASYDESNKQITWKLIGDSTREESGDEGNKIYKYQLNYRIKLNTLRDGFKAGDLFATNGVTSLSYFIREGSEPVENPQLSYAYFNVPSVKGFADDLTFTKVDANNEPLAGAAFKITANDDPNWSMDGTPSEDGTSFTFTGIPSGHTYTLTETPPEGYQDLDGTYTVEVAYGEAVLKKGADTVTAIVNTPKVTPTGSLTITKEFGRNSAITANNWPDGKQLTFTIVKEGETNGNNVKLPTNDPTNPWSATVVDLAPGIYTVTESDAEADVTGYNLTVTNGNQGTVTVTGGGASTITFTNTYTPETINIPVTKEWNDEGYENSRPSSVTVKLLANGQEVAGKTLTLDATATTGGDPWTGTFMDLPKYENGEVINYTVDEVLPNDTYSKSVEKNNDGSFTITNTKLADGETVVTVQKNWEAPDGTIYPEVSVNVLKDNIVVDTIKLNKDNDWKGSSKVLDKYPDGAIVGNAPINYTVREVVPNGYIAREPVYNETEKVWQITNKIEKQYTVKLVKRVEGYEGSLSEVEVTVENKEGTYKKTHKVPVNSSIEIQVPAGTYTVTENTTGIQVPGYTLNTTCAPNEFTVSADTADTADAVGIAATVTVTNTYTKNSPTPTPTPTPTHSHRHDHVPPVVYIPPKTGDISLWTAVLAFFGF